MPHVNVKPYPGRSAEEKAELARAITKDFTAVLKSARSPANIRTMSTSTKSCSGPTPQEL